MGTFVDPAGGTVPALDVIVHNQGQPDSPGGSNSVNISGFGGTTVTIGQAVGAASIPVVIASDQTMPISGSVTGNLILSAGTAIVGKVGIDQTTDGTTNAVHLTAGTNLVGKVGIDQTTPGTTNGVQVAAALPAGTNNIGNVSLAPQTSGGLSLSRTIIPNNTTAVVVKGSAGQLYGIQATNNSATIAYIKIYNATSATAGSGTPVDTVMIPAPAAGGGGGIVWHQPNGVAYGTGITFVVTTGIADNDTGVPSASTYIVTFYYK